MAMMMSDEARRSGSRFPASIRDDLGGQDYTNAGQADADLASALMALDAVLRRSDLTAAQRRDFGAARRWTFRAAQAVTRHMDYGDA
jgi:hypothetical protein